MNKKQWKAVADYCAEYGYDSPRELLRELKGCGVIGCSETLNDLGEYPDNDSYDAMFAWSGENV